MKKKLLIITAMLLAGATYGKALPVSGKTDSAAVAAQLNEMNIRYGQSFEKGDSSMFISCYTEDACLLPANSPAICGRSGQLAFYKLAYRSGVRQIIFHTLALYGLTSTSVTEQGAYEMYNADNKSLGKGKYIVVWKKTAGGWKMHRDMFNADAPPAKPTAHSDDTSNKLNKN